MTTGAVVLGTAQWLSPELVPWLLPVALPMVLAPAIIAWSSRPSGTALFSTRTELRPAPVMQLHDRVMLRWTASDTGQTEAA